MAGGDETAAARKVLYCVVPRDLAPKLHEPLREHFRDEPGVEVVVEQRAADRRDGRARRSASSNLLDRPDRRRIRSASGRRIGDRRALAVSPTGLPPLPRKALRYARRLAFVERLAPTPQALRDADSKRLVVRFQAGDESVFGDLYLRYFDAVYTYAKMGLGEHHEAEDVTQQVFMRALAALDRYELRPNIAFRGWLFSIARNVVIDALKQRQTTSYEAPEQLEALRENGPVGLLEPAAETLGWLSDREVAMFVERLPLAQRQVLILRFMLDLNAEEIAAILGRSPNSVRKLQSRALQLLQSRLASVGRTAPRRGGVPMLVRIRPLPVMGQRRYAIGGCPAPGRRAAA